MKIKIQNRRDAKIQNSGAKLASAPDPQVKVMERRNYRATECWQNI